MKNTRCFSTKKNGIFIYYIFQHCTDHIMMGRFLARGNQYVQLVKVLFCKLPTICKKLQSLTQGMNTTARPLEKWCGNDANFDTACAIDLEPDLTTTSWFFSHSLYAGLCFILGDICLGDMIHSAHIKLVPAVFVSQDSSLFKLSIYK